MSVAVTSAPRRASTHDTRPQPAPSSTARRPASAPAPAPKRRSRYLLSTMLLSHTVLAKPCSVAVSRSARRTHATPCAAPPGQSGAALCAASSARRLHGRGGTRTAGRTAPRPTCAAREEASVQRERTCRSDALLRTCSRASTARCAGRRTARRTCASQRAAQAQRQRRRQAATHASACRRAAWRHATDPRAAGNALHDAKNGVRTAGARCESGARLTQLLGAETRKARHGNGTEASHHHVYVIKQGQPRQAPPLAQETGSHSISRARLTRIAPCGRHARHAQARAPRELANPAVGLSDLGDARSAAGAGAAARPLGLATRTAAAARAMTGRACQRPAAAGGE